jgi:hypothetical protein
MKKILLSGMALTLLLVACGEEEGVTPPPPENAPADVIKNVEISFNQRNISYLKNSLRSDFCFYFDPDDVGQSPPGSHYVIPESWSYTEFYQYVETLYENAYMVTLSIPTAQIGTPGPAETAFRAENVELTLLVMVDEKYGYICDRGYCDFEFGLYYNESRDRFWRLVKWKDYTSVAGDSYASPEPTSLGKILALYK